MKTTGLLLIVILIASFTQCTTGTKEGETQATTDSSALIINEFFVSTMEAGQLSLELATLAARSTNEDLRSLGETIVSLNTALLEELKGLATLKNVQLPDSVEAGKMRSIRAINEKTGAEFDQAVARMLGSEQRKFFSHIRRSKEIRDAEIDAFAEKNKKSIREVSGKIRGLRKKMNPDPAKAKDERPA